MPALTLTTLALVPIAVVVSKKDAQPFRPGRYFLLAVVITNNGDRTLEWAREKALNLSYRWVDELGRPIERDGLRTPIPTSKLEPGVQVEVELRGAAPEHPGVFELQVSLVLEGVHWACDLGSTGWDRREVAVTAAPAWPTEFKDSRGARSLRGAILAHELARMLDEGTFADQHEVLSTAVSTESLGDGKLETVSGLARLRERVRHALGVDGLERQLAAVLALASRQDQQAKGLEQQISMLREQLMTALEPPEVRAPQFEEDLSNARKQVRAYLAGQGILPISRGAQPRKSKRSLRAAKPDGRSVKPSA